jgi:alpha-galactosidase
MYDTEALAKVTIAYVGGGSLNWAPKLMADLAADRRLGGEVRLYDLDAAAAARNAAIGNRFAAATGTAMYYRATGSLAETLEGAGVVVVSILPGSFEDMGHDIDIPARHGIRQSVGDTVGPGGFVRALRAIPAVLGIGRAVATHAPQAWVCNLTNPMSVLTGALYRAHPGIRAWGECHEVVKTRRLGAVLAARRTGRRISQREVMVNVLGINHFTFVDRIAAAGLDLTEDYRAFAAEHLAGWRAAPLDPADEHARLFEDHARVGFDLLRRFGIAGAAGDRHLAEFLPQADYLDAAEAWGFGLTPVDYRKRERAEKAAAAEALAADGPLPAAARSDEALVDQIVALMGGPVHVSNANLPNRGQVAGLPEGAVVETNAVFSGLGIQPVVAGRLPAALEPLVAGHARRQTALLDAVFAADWGALPALFASDPLVAPLGPSRARDLLTEMIAATAHRLPPSLAKGGF